MVPESSGRTKGGSRAHKFLKGPKGWVPDQVFQLPGQEAAPLSAQARAEATRLKWLRGPWSHAGPGLTAADWGRLPELRPLSARQLRKAAFTFSPGSAAGMDSWHPREYGHLSDGCLEVLSGLIALMEKWAVLPEEMLLQAIVFLGKPDGGYRPIGLLASLVRLRGAARRPEVRAWEQGKASQAFFWGSGGRGAEECIWDQAVEAEYALSTGKEASAVLLDLVKAYELFRHDVLKKRLWQAEFPLAQARWGLMLYPPPPARWSSSEHAPSRSC